MFQKVDLSTKKNSKRYILHFHKKKKDTITQFQQLQSIQKNRQITRFSANNNKYNIIFLLYFALVSCVYVCAIPSACLRSLLACILCCDCQDPLHPPDPDPPLPSSPSAARPSLTPLQGVVERPQTTLPLPSHSLAPLGHWTVAVRGPLGVEAMGDRGSVAGLSCSTLTPSEGMDMRQLLRTPRRQHRVLGSFCSRVAARLRRMNSNTWCDCQLWTLWTTRTF